MSNDNTVDSVAEAPITEIIGQAEVDTEIGEAPEVAKIILLGTNTLTDLSS
jgi:hypothetical protein